MISRKRRVSIWIGLAIWTAFIAWWAITPLTETLEVRGPDGAVIADDEGAPLTVEVECGAPIARDIGDPFATIPDGASLERPTCERTQSQNQTLLWINAVAIGLVAAGMVVATRRAPGDSPADLSV